MRQDWETIKAAYVQGDKTLRELAEERGIPYSTLSRQAAKGGWLEEKEAERRKLAEALKARATSKRAKREALALERVETQMEKLLAEVEKALADPRQLYRHILYVGKGKQDELELGKMDTRAAKDFTDILAQLRETLAGMGGVLDKRTAEELRLKKARLKLDREKAGLNGTGMEDETGVLVVPALDEGPTPEVEIGGEEA